MKAKILFLFLLCSYSAMSQELYVSTEPASNMAKNSIGIRLANEGIFKPQFQSRFVPEIMFGVSKNLMVHTSAYVSDFYQANQKFEGYSLYAKYRFFTIDSIKKHLRAAVYGRFSDIKNPAYADEINLEGDNSGLQGGLVVTQLLHRVALSGSVSYNKRLDNRGEPMSGIDLPDNSIAYTFSTGYLAYPKVYTSYKQPNLNLYVEFLGKSNPGRSQNFMEVAPAIQLILNSTTRIDLSKRVELWSNMTRMTKNMYLVRLEYNFFNVL
ncbi:MAG: hypothetical protein ABI390_03825 [Daejeonella sp.]